MCCINRRIAIRTSHIAVSNSHIAIRNSQFATPYGFISDLTICRIGGIMNAEIPIRAMPVPEIMNAFAIPIESAMNPVARRPIIEGRRVMLP